MEENEEIKKAKEELDKISQDAKERRLAELRDKALMDEIVIRDSGYNEGKKETQIEIAKNMLNKNFNVKQISELTDLSAEEIEKLK